MKKLMFVAAAALCFSGQSAREVDKEVPQTKSEVAVETPKKEEQKSAAKRSMEDNTSYVPKGAAKLAVEREL